MREGDAGAMRPGGEAAGRHRGGSAARRGGRPTGGGSRPGERTARRQFHLGDETAKRLSVHCSLADRNESAFVEEVLGSWLARYGRGRELWAPGDRGPQLAPDAGEDRQELPAA